MALTAVLATYFIRVNLGRRLAVLHSQTTAQRTTLGGPSSYVQPTRQTLREEVVDTSIPCREPIVPSHSSAGAVQPCDRHAG